MQKKYITYVVVAIMLAVLVAPTLALALTNPTVPPGVGGTAVTASTLEKLINAVVQFLITISVVIAVGVIIWGGLTYMRDPKAGTEILKNGFIGVLIILGVGLIMSTIQRFVSTGGSIN